MFEDMEDSIAEMSRTLSRLGFSIRRNLRPHLYAPAGSILTEDGSNVRINEKGMISPLTPVTLLLATCNGTPARRQ